MYYFEISIFRWDPKIFLKSPLAPIYTNFEGSTCAKKPRFIGQNFQKSAKKAAKISLSKNIFLSVTDKSFSLHLMSMKPNSLIQHFHLQWFCFIA